MRLDNLKIASPSLAASFKGQKIVGKGGLSLIGDTILYTTTTGGKTCHGHFDPLPSASGV